MAHLFQVGVGSGGMVVLDLLMRDPRIDRVTLVDPDRYEEHNAVRHLFPPTAAGRLKVDLAAEWISQFRPDITVDLIPAALESAEHRDQIERAVAASDFGICAVDVESAKFAFDALMRQYSKPWTLGEVLSGGIGGWVHLFRPQEACYGCVASHLQREVRTDRSPAPDYSDPQAALPTARIPASKASIGVIASLHAQLTLSLLEGIDPGFSSILLPLARVENVFPEAFKPFRFCITRLPECLICGSAVSTAPAGEDLDVALDSALARLGHE